MTTDAPDTTPAPPPHTPASTGWSFETQQVHAGASPDPTTGARATPIYQTTSFVFRDTQHGADLFSLAEPGNIYTRIMNPTQDVLEQRVAALEGGVAALAFASGQRGHDAAILNLAQAGDHFVSSPSSTAARTTSSTTRCPRWASRSRSSRTRTTSSSGATPSGRTPSCSSPRRIANPGSNVLDVAGVAGVAHEVGVPLVVDNTVPTPFLLRPIEHGADIVIHSRDQVPRRARHDDRAASSSTAARSTSAPTATASPASPSPTRATTA